MRFQVTTTHGESASVFDVWDTKREEVVHSFSTAKHPNAAALAEREAAKRNDPRPVYLVLFHGRETTTEVMNDWGDNADPIGPLKWVVCTYGTALRFEFLHAEDARAFFEAGGTTSTRKQGWDGATEGEVPLVEGGLIAYRGRYYGDFEIHAGIYY